MTYVLIATLTLFFGLVSYQEAPPIYAREAFAVPTCIAYALSAPSSLIIQLLITVAGDYGPKTIAEWLGSTKGVVGTLASCFVAGYWQWFVLLPRIFRRQTKAPTD